MSKRKQRPRRGADGDYNPKDVQRQSRKRKKERGRSNRPVFYVPPDLGDDFDSKFDDEPQDDFDYDKDALDFWSEDDDEEYRR